MRPYSTGAILQRLNGVHSHQHQVKIIITRSILAACVLAGSAALKHGWLTHSDLGPQVPPALSLWLVERYRSTNGEELRDLETLVALGTAFILVLTLTLSGWFLFRGHMRRRGA